MSENIHITPHDHTVTAKDREKQNGHKGLAVWLTGLSGSGKSTIASRLEQLLMHKGIHTYILDGDNIRAGLNKGLTFSAEDRHENLRRIAEVAKLFTDAGLVVISAFVSPLEKDRKMVRKTIGNDNFAEIFIKTSLDECERRDVKGLYKKARQGEIHNFTGISAPYEAPEKPDLAIPTEDQNIEQGAKNLCNYILDQRKITEL